MNLITFTWRELITVAILLTVIYLFLQIVNRIIIRRATENDLGYKIKRILHIVLTIYEPMVFILLACMFVFINPLLHGLIIALLLLLGFLPIRDYMLGRIVHIDSEIEVGKRLQTADSKGLVMRLGNIGLHLRTKDSLSYITYSNLIKNGYSLISTEELGGFFRLEITPNQPLEYQKYTQNLLDLLAAAPYLDKGRKPKLSLINEERMSVKASLVLVSENQLGDLVELIREWGYQVKIL